MALLAKRHQVVAGVEQESSAGAVRLVAGKAVTFLYRGVHDLLAPHAVMAGFAQRPTDGREFEAFGTLQRVLLGTLHVAAETVAVLDRPMQLLERGDIGMAGRGYAAFSPGATGGEKGET